MDKLKQIWIYLDGKKQKVGAYLGLVLTWVGVKGWLDEETMVMLASALTLWMGVAGADAIQKQIKKKAL
jgi:hypothetical protein